MTADASGAPTEVPAPRFSEERYGELVRAMVANHAPRLFAVVEDFGERVDGRVAGWPSRITSR